MRIAFVVNSIATEKPEYTTTRLALTASRMGHETWLIGVDDFSQRPDGAVAARARAAKGRQYKSLERYLEALQGAQGIEERVCVHDLDVIVMRNDPADDMVDRPWACTSGVLFGQLAATAGTLVVNDPASLASALNKTYFQRFPEVVRPRTLISRDPTELADFVEELGGRGILKPLQGSGGTGVFLVSGEEAPNINQIIEAIGRDGYVVAQEYLKAATDGDVRLFVMNGEPLTRDGAYAAFRRVNRGGDVRSNMHAGGQAEPVEVDDGMLELVDLVRPQLLEDGMFLVGLDIVGDKLMEVNVFSPGGLGSAQSLYDKDFAEPVIDALAHKVDVRGHYGAIENARLATL